MNDDYSHIVETVVLNELIARGFKVYAGKLRNGEVDFVVSSSAGCCYIQVAYLLSTPETIEREFGTFSHISDSYPKYVVTMDSITNDINGIKHIRLVDFLSDASLLKLG